MFLSLGGSRRRAAQAHHQQQQQQQQQGNVQLQASTSSGLLQPDGNLQGLLREDPLQALASGKYAPAPANLPRGEDGSSSLVCGYTSPKQSSSLQGSVSCSPKSILTYYLPNVPSLSREVSSDSGVSLVGGEEAISRDSSVFEPARRSQTLDLAKKLRSSLGSKFADSLRDTIKEVAMKHDTTNAWPLGHSCLDESSNIASTSGGEPVSHPHAWESPLACGLPALDAAESSMKQRTSTAEHSKRLSWFSQENLSQAAIAELSWGRPAQGASPSSTGFFSPRHSDMSLGAILKDSSPKESWTDCSTMSRLRSAGTRRHFFPEAAAMGTSDRDLQHANPNFRPRGDAGMKPSLSKKASELGDQFSFPDVSKGVGKDYESLLELLNPAQSCRQRVHAKQAAAAAVGRDSCEPWQAEASTSYYEAPVMELSEVGVPGSTSVKRPREDGYSAQLWKRQCLLEESLVDDSNADPLITGVFEEYLANLASTARVPSFELPGSPLSNLLEDFSQDSIVPIHLP